MAHVAKRPRLHGPNRNPSLTLSSAPAPKLRNLQLEHENSLRESAQRLKTSWEDICRRYGRDFGLDADEVDINTGEVVVDNGHLRGLKEDAEDTWGLNADDDEEGDTGSPTSSLEMEILARRPILGRNEMGGPIMRDDEAEEIDVDEEVDRDAIDDLFDELEELTMTSAGKEKRRREKDSKAQEAQASQASIPKDQAGLDSIPSPASSEPAEEEMEDAPSIQSATKESDKDETEVTSPDEVPPDDAIMGRIVSKWGTRLLAYVKTLAEGDKPADITDPALAAQLTPVSECGKPLAEQLADAVERIVSENELAGDVEEAEVTEPEKEGSVEAEANQEFEDAREDIEEEQEQGRDSELLVSLNDLAKEALREETISESSSGHMPSSDTIIEVVIETSAFTNIVRSKVDHTPEGTNDRPFILDDSSESGSDTLMQIDFDPPAAQPTSDQEKFVEVSKVLPEPKITMEESHTAEEQPAEIDYIYGDIDDLSTIVVPKVRVPVTPKNRPRSMSRSLRKVISSKKRGRPSLSEIRTPNQVRPTTSSKRKQSISGTSVGSRLPRNFWSALPDDPFYDPLWQDFHPDGEPDFEEFERRRILLDKHTAKRPEQQDVIDDDELAVMHSSPVRNRKSSQAQTPKPREKKTPKSRRARKEDDFEKKLHTPRSGKFLEYIQKKKAEERDSHRKETKNTSGIVEASSDLPIPEAESPTKAIESPSKRMNNDYGLSESESDSSKELVFLGEKNLQIVDSQTKKRTRGRPRKVPLPLVAPDQPFSPNSRKVKDGEAEVNSDPFAKCGDPGYRCKKAICFKCIEDVSS